MIELRMIPSWVNGSWSLFPSLLNSFDLEGDVDFVSQDETAGFQNLPIREPEILPVNGCRSGEGRSLIAPVVLDFSI